MSKPTILFYEPEGAAWLPKVRQLCAIQGLRLRQVSTDELEQSVQALLTEQGSEGLAPGGEPLGEGVMVFCSTAPGQLDRMLTALRKAGMKNCLKAVLTPTNAGWTFRALYKELCREREQMGVHRAQQ